ncbi:MAG: CopG family transcriptional regulator [Hormoscilla sp. GUM202]|nr:CopG family transcriptional regulator [Hormoscilla sp. GUM202]
MKAQEFDRKFDAGEDISQLLDLSKAKRPRRKQQRIQLDLPTWMIEQLQPSCQPPRGYPPSDRRDLPC